MRTARISLLFFLLFAVSTYPQNVLASGSGIEITTTEISTSSVRPEGLTTVSANGEENLAETRQRIVKVLGAKEQESKVVNAYTNNSLNNRAGKEGISIATPEPSSAQASVIKAKESQTTDGIQINTPNPTGRTTGSSTPSTSSTNQIENATELGPVEGLENSTIGQDVISDTSSSSSAERTEAAVTEKVVESEATIAGEEGILISAPEPSSAQAPVIEAKESQTTDGIQANTPKPTDSTTGSNIPSTSTTNQIENPTTLGPVEGLGKSTIKQDELSDTSSSSSAERTEAAVSEKVAESEANIAREVGISITTPEPSSEQASVIEAKESQTTDGILTNTPNLTDSTAGLNTTSTSSTNQIENATALGSVEGLGKSTIGQDELSDTSSSSSTERSEAAVPEKVAESEATTVFKVEEAPAVGLSESTVASQPALPTDDVTATTLGPTPSDTVTEPSEATTAFKVEKASAVGLSESTVATQPASQTDDMAATTLGPTPSDTVTEPSEATTAFKVEKTPAVGLSESTTVASQPALPTDDVTATTLGPTPSDTVTEPSEVTTTFKVDQAPAVGLSESTVASQPALPTDDVTATSLGPTPSDPVTESSEAAVPKVDTTIETQTTNPQDTVPPVTQTTEGPTDTKSTNRPATLPNPCTEPGNFTSPTNCHTFISCSGNATGLLRQENECPERSAFSPAVRRCTRDISPCGDNEPICLAAGSLTDPLNNSSYYWCIPSLLSGFHKYHIQCATNEVYNALIGRCWPEDPQNSLINVQQNDRDIVRAEWKKLKKEIKIKAKEEKIRQKMEAKAKARAEKLAAKEQKKQKRLTTTDDEVMVMIE